MSSTSSTRLSKHTGKLYDKATGEYLGRIERSEIDGHRGWWAFPANGPKQFKPRLNEARVALVLIDDFMKKPMRTDVRVGDSVAAGSRQGESK